MQFDRIEPTSIKVKVPYDSGSSLFFPVKYGDSNRSLTIKINNAVIVAQPLFLLKLAIPEDTKRYLNEVENWIFCKVKRSTYRNRVKDIRKEKMFEIRIGENNNITYESCIGDSINIIVEYIGAYVTGQNKDVYFNKRIRHIELLKPTVLCALPYPLKAPPPPPPPPSPLPPPPIFKPVSFMIKRKDGLVSSPASFKAPTLTDILQARSQLKQCRSKMKDIDI